MSSFSGGSHLIKATYSGSANFAGSVSGNQTVTVNKVAHQHQRTRRAGEPGAAVAAARLRLQATVTSANGPVAGVPVAFTIGSSTVCTSTTNAFGVASCNALPQLLSLTLLGFKASFAGNGDYLGSTAQGVILK